MIQLGTCALEAMRDVHFKHSMAITQPSAQSVVPMFQKASNLVASSSLSNSPSPTRHRPSSTAVPQKRKSTGGNNGESTRKNSTDPRGKSSTTKTKPFSAAHKPKPSTSTIPKVMSRKF